MLRDKILDLTADSYGQSFERYAERLAAMPKERGVADALYPTIATRLDWQAYRAAARPIFERAVRATPFPAEDPRIRALRERAADWRGFADALCQFYMTADAKFCLIEPWLNEKLPVFAFLNLQEPKGLSILDLGCGAGHFSLLAEAAGHRIAGVDIENALIADLARRFGIERRIQPVHPRFFQEDRAGERFDLITSLLLNFNRRDGRLWDAADWEVFLAGATEALAPGGRICFLLNTQSGWEGLRAADGSLQNFLGARGFRIFPYYGAYPGRRLCLYRAPAG